MDNSSVYWEDVLYFRGQDGHIYSFDGTNVQRISRDITNSIIQAQNRISNSWTQSSASDFNSGTFLPNTYVDTMTALGSIQFYYPDNFSAFRDGANSTANVWHSWCSPSCSSNVVVSNGNLVFTANGAAPGQDQLIGNNF